MLASRAKSRLAVGILSLLFLAGAVACNGFFIDPVLTTVAVGPQATIAQGAIVQMSAVGTYNDGSSRNITSST